MMLKHCIGCSGPRLGNGQQKSIQMRKFVFFCVEPNEAKVRTISDIYTSTLLNPSLFWYDTEMINNTKMIQLGNYITNTWARVPDLAFLVHLPLLGPEKQPYEDTYSTLLYFLDVLASLRTMFDIN